MSGEIQAAHYENRTERQIHCEQIQRFLNFKASGTYSYHCALKVLTEVFFLNVPPHKAQARKRYHLARQTILRHHLNNVRVHKHPSQHSTIVKLSISFPTLRMSTELNTCITVFQFNLPWIRRKTALETPAMNPGGQAILKTSRTQRRKFQRNWELGIKNHITYDTVLTAGSQSRETI